MLFEYGASYFGQKITANHSESSQDRKEVRLQALDTEIEDMRASLRASQRENQELKTALSSARTQLDTLKSILPTILQPRSPEAMTRFDLVQDRESLNAAMNFQLSRLLQNGAAKRSSETHNTTPESFHSDENFQRPFDIGRDWRN